MRKLYFLSLAVCLFFLQTSKIYAQNIGIGTTTPRPFALLEIKSQTSGLLVPRVDISDPVFLGLGALDHGLIVFDTLLNQLQVWNGAAWQTASSAWSVNGADVFYNSGNVGIGTNTPLHALDLAGGNVNVDLTHAYLQNGTHLISFSPSNNNIRIGANAAPSITTGNEIIAIGNNAGLSIQDGGSNIAIGEEALRNTVSGAGNIGIGRLAMIFNNGGSGNVALGPEALHNNSSGNNNVGVGADANYSNSTGGFNTAVGGGAGVLSPNLDNATAIGGLAKVNANNSMVLGMINGVGGGFADVSVGIGTPTPNQNASLDLGHNDRGLQVNRVDRASLSLAASDRGMTVYDSVTNELIVWNGAAWESATAAGAAPTLQSAYDGGQTVNMGTGNINFISSAANSVLYIDEASEEVGVGTATPNGRFNIHSQNLVTTGGDVLNLTGASTGSGTIGMRFSSTNSSLETNAASITLKNFISTDKSLQFINNNPLAIPSTRMFRFLNNATAPILTMLNGGNVGIGTENPTNFLHVTGDAARFDSVIISNNAQAGYVLTSADASGAASWQPAAGGNSWDLTGNAGTSGANFIGTTDAQNLAFRTSNFTRMTINTAGAVGINSIPTGTSYLTVGNATLAQAIQGTNSRATASSNTGIRGDASGSTAANYGLYGNAFGAGSTARGVYGAAGTAATAIGVEGAVAGAGTTTAYGVRGLATSTGTDNYGIYGQASGGTNNYAGFFQGNMITTANVGIGNLTPNAPLQFTTSLANRKIVLFEGANNDHQFFGFGVNGAALRYQVNGTFASHIFYASVNTTTSNELMRIIGDGRVGIGTSTPTAGYRLDVTGGDAIINGVTVGRGGGNNTNTALGENALASNAGADNIGIGRNALQNNLGGLNNIAIGNNSLGLNTTGGGNLAIGHGSQNGAAGTGDNVSLGNNTLTGNQGNLNTALGNNTLANNTTGNSNHAIGYNALNGNLIGSGNIAMGNEALFVSDADANIAIGGRALIGNTSGEWNVSVGARSSENNTTGINNTTVGAFAMDQNVSGSNNTAIGYGATTIGGNLNNATAIGANANVSASNRMVLGATGTAVQFDGELRPADNPGLAGQVLTSAGPGATPTWSAAGGSSLWTLNGSDAYYNAGNIGIGLTAPVNALDVVGGAVIGSATYAGFTTAPLNGLTVEGNVELGALSGGSNYRLYSFISNLDPTTRYTMYNLNNYAGALEKYGIYNSVPGSGTGVRYGTYNQMLAASANTFGTYNNITPGNASAYGVYNSITPLNTGNRYGEFTSVLSGAANTSPAWGTLLTVNHLGTGIVYGTQVNVTRSGASGLVYGHRVNETNNGSSDSYMFYGNSTGSAANRYGTYMTGETANYFSANVGIGTTAPTYLLDIESASPTMRLNSTGNSSQIRFENAGSGLIGTIGDPGSSEDLEIVGVNRLLINTGFAYRMAIDNIGNVGIGTITPAARLQITGGDITLDANEAIGIVTSTDQFSYDGKTTGNYSLGWYNDTWDPSPSAWLSGFGGIKFITGGPSGTPSPKMSINYNGNVGIGTETQTYRLQVEGGPGVYIRPQTGGENFISFVNSNDGNIAWGINDGWTVNRDFRIYRYNNAGTFIDQPFTIQNATGNIGIGVVNPGDALQVNGTVRATTLIAQSLAGFGVNPIASRRLWTDAGSTDIALYASQLDGSAGKYAVFGEGRNGGTTAWLNVSDRRLKKNITPLSNALENVLKLRGVNFDWRNEEFPDKGLAKGHDIGLIAQEVKAIYPEFVNHAPDGFYGVSYAGLVPVLIEAIKEQQSLIDNQRTQIESLQAYNKEERVNGLKTQEQLNSLQAQIDRLNNLLSAEAKK